MTIQLAKSSLALRRKRAIRASKRENGDSIASDERADMMEKARSHWTGTFGALFFAAVLFVCAPTSGWAADADDSAGDAASTTASTSASATSSSSSSTTVDESDDSAQQVLADGTYLFTWDKNSKYIAQSASNSRKANADVVLGKSATTTRQRWVVKYQAKYGAYTIVNEYSKKALAVTSKKSGANVVQVKKQTGATLQLWTVTETGSAYVFSPVANSKLALTGAATAGGYDLSVKANTGAKAQRFLMKTGGIVRDGLYSLALSKNAKKVATVPGYSMSNGKALWLYTYQSTMNQKYQVKRVSGDRYTLQSLNSGKYVGVSGSSVVQAAGATALARQWTVTWNQTGLSFVNAKTGKALTVPGAKAKNKALLTTQAVAANAAQRFALTKRAAVNNGLYLVRTFAGKRALTVKDGSVASKANIDAETVSSGNKQKFRIKYVKGGSYRLTNVKSGLVIEVASNKNGANVRQGKYLGSSKQLWKARAAANGGVQFVNVSSGKVLDIAGTKNTSGANVRAAKSDGTAQQRWWLQKTTVNAAEVKADKVQNKALRKAQSKGSATNWFIAVDVTNHRTIIFKRSGSTWKVAKNWLCSVGKPSTPTVLGTFTVGIKGYSFGSGYTCYYYTQFYGDYLFHSVKYYQGTFQVKDGRLGQDVSEGCVRLKINNAKWIYNHIPSGTKVVTYR